MQAGKLDVAQNSFETLVSFRFQEFAKFVTVGGYSTITVFAPIIVSKTLWDNLSEGEKQALEMPRQSPMSTWRPVSAKPRRQQSRLSPRRASRSSN